jgi:hypothetical protein
MKQFVVDDGMGVGLAIQRRQFKTFAVCGAPRRVSAETQPAFATTFSMGMAKNGCKLFPA